MCICGIAVIYSERKPEAFGREADIHSLATLLGTYVQSNAIHKCYQFYCYKIIIFF